MFKQSGRKSCIRLLTILCCLAVLLTIPIGCSEDNQPSVVTSPTEIDIDPPPSEEELMQLRAEELVAGMTTEEKAGSLLVVRGNTVEQSELVQLIKDVKAGGVTLFSGNFKDKTEDEVKQMISEIQEAGGGSMLISVDEEGGIVNRLSRQPLLREEPYKSPQDIFASGGFDAIAADTLDKCEFLKRFGVNVNFAPVADVTTDPEGFLYSRAFGQNAEETARYVELVVSIMKENGVGCCIKHFPGYGNSHGDTHEGLVASDVTAESLWSSDLVPFIAGINAGTDSIMITHTIISALDPDVPATFAPAVYELIRNDLGFDGVTITDGLDMDAITQYCNGEDPAVAAFLAGNDLLCIPPDPRASYDSLLAAYRDGQITDERLDQSVVRIIKWKLSLGLLS